MIFRKKIRTAQVGPGYVSNMLSSVQRKAADYLNGKTANWSSRQLKVTLILFCLLMGNLCLYILGKAILSANGPPDQIKVQRLSAPMPLIKSGQKLQKGDTAFKQFNH
jgi:hypothetical protein